MRELKILISQTPRDEQSLNRYLNEIGNFPMITAEEEVILTRKIKAGDLAAQHRLVTANLRFVVSVAKKYQNKGITMSDLINEGNMGLIKAATLFDETRGFKFISYAVWWIRQSMINALNENVRLVRLPMNQQIGMTGVLQHAQKLEQQLEREPTLSELAESMETDEGKIADFINSNIKMKYMDAPAPGDDNDDNTMHNYLPSTDVTLTDAWMDKEETENSISELMEILTEREKQVIMLSFGLYGYEQHDMQDVAKAVKLSTERTRQIKAMAIEKMRTGTKRSLQQHSKTVRQHLHIARILLT